MAGQRAAGNSEHRADLLGETVDGEVVHLEFMSKNLDYFDLQMAGYCLEIYRASGRHPHQTLVYVGREKRRMRGHFKRPTMSFRFRVVDLRVLRDIETEVAEEIRKVPILDSLLDHKVLGREFKKGLEQVLAQGIEQGRIEGEVKLLRRQLEYRFKKLPKWVADKLAAATPAQIEEWGDSKSLAAIFGGN